MNNKIEKSNSISEGIQNKFHSIAQIASSSVGSPVAFMISFLGILVWAFSGPIFKFSDTWQLIINTSTTVITFLMVFLIQHTQNRDARAIHLKLDELIRANKHARNHLIDLQSLSDAELDQLHEELCHAQSLNEEKIQDIKKRKVLRNESKHA